MEVRYHYFDIKCINIVSLDQDYWGKSLSYKYNRTLLFIHLSPLGWKGIVIACLEGGGGGGGWTASGTLWTR